MLTPKTYQNKLCQPDGGARRGDTSAERRALRSPLYFFSFSAGAREVRPASAQTRTHFCSSQRRELRAGWGRPRSRSLQRSTSAVLKSVPVVDARLTPSRVHIQKLIGPLDFDKPIKISGTCLKLFKQFPFFANPILLLNTTTCIMNMIRNKQPRTHCLKLGEKRVGACNGFQT